MDVASYGRVHADEGQQAGLVMGKVHSKAPPTGMFRSLHHQITATNYLISDPFNQGQGQRPWPGCDVIVICQIVQRPTEYSDSLDCLLYCRTQKPFKRKNQIGDDEYRCENAPEAELYVRFHHLHVGCAMILCKIYAPLSPCATIMGFGGSEGSTDKVQLS